MSLAIKVDVKETEPATVAYLVRKGSFAQMPESFGRLYGWLGQRGYTPSAAPSGVFLDMPGRVPEEECRWELWAPVAGEVPESGPDEEGLGVKKVGQQLVASTVHRGRYEEEGPIFEALTGWIYQNGYEIAGPVEEVYLNGPDEAMPENYLTEIRFPIRRRQ